VYALVRDEICAQPRLRGYKMIFKTKRQGRGITC
jgi:hypothetical protein